MNKAKARDFFSDYYEGTLDKGLRQVFERVLADDAALKAEYEEFKVLMGDLDSLNLVEVPEPAFLSERIQSRVHAALDAQEKPAGGAWWLSWGRWAFAGVAAFAILGIAISINRVASGQVTQAGLIGGAPASTAEIAPRLDYTEEKGLAIELRPLQEANVIIRNGRTGKVIVRKTVAPGQYYREELVNQGSRAMLVEVQFVPDYPQQRVALPGAEPAPQSKGSGTVADLALALADTFNKPVQLEVSNLDAPVVWDFAKGDAIDAARDVVRDLNLSLELRANGILFLN